MTLQAAILHLAGHNDGLRPHLLPLMRVAGPPTKLYPVIEQMIAAMGMAPLPSAQVKALAMALAVSFPSAVEISTEFWTDLAMNKPSAEDETTAFWGTTSDHHPHDPRYSDEEGETEVEYPSKWTGSDEVRLDLGELLYSDPFFGLSKRYKLGTPIDRNERAIWAVMGANARVLIPFFLAAVRNRLSQAKLDADLGQEVLGYHDVLYEEIRDPSKLHFKSDYKLGRVQITGRVWKLPFTATLELNIAGGGLQVEEPEPDFDPPDEYDDYESSHYASVRHQVIHKAASLPKGSDARRKLLTVLKG